MEVGAVKHFRSAAMFRRWLEKHHASERELWVGIYKAASGLGGITYEQARDEGLCFGWIDGFTKSIDEDAYTVRFTPRKPNSNWSDINVARVKELRKEGRVRAPGLAAFKART